MVIFLRAYTFLGISILYKIVMFYKVFQTQLECKFQEFTKTV